MSRAQLRSISESLLVPQIGLWSGAVSSGKTVASLLAFLIALSTAPDRGLIVIVGRTLQTIERNIIDPLQSVELFGLAVVSHVHHTRGSTVARILGRTVHLIGASDVRAEGRIRGATIALAYVDEATLLPESFWLMLLSRLRVAGARLLATTNPDGPGHWLRTGFLARGLDVGLVGWHLTLDDNPSLPVEYVSRLKRQYTGLWYKRFILGEWCLAEGAIYDCWDPDRHVLRGPVPTLVRLPGLGIDYGTTNPFAALMLGVLADGRLCLTREWRWDSKRTRRALTDAEYSHRRRAWMPPDQPEWVVVDPSAASMVAQLHHDRITTVAGDNSVIDGIRLVASLLALGLLVVHESCAGWISEAPGYVWDPEKSKLGKDEPIKLDDHSLDAGRYVIKTTRVLWQTLLREPVITY